MRANLIKAKLITIQQVNTHVVAKTTTTTKTIKRVRAEMSFFSVPSWLRSKKSQNNKITMIQFRILSFSLGGFFSTETEILYINKIQKCSNLSIF